MMKYIKPFSENEISEHGYEEINQAISEIKNLSHILEDEGWVVKVNKSSRKLHSLSHKFDGRNIYDIFIFVLIEKSKDACPMDSHTTYSISKTEYFQEWYERLIDICRDFEMEIPPVKRVMYSPFLLSYTIKTNRRIKFQQKPDILG